jgi:hypothetical protein
MLDDGWRKRVVSLNRSYLGLYVPPLVWRHLENFSTNAVCLVLSSWPFTEEDYVPDYGEYTVCAHPARLSRSGPA